MDIDEGFQDEIGDVPFGKELYDEQIPELDSVHEQSKYGNSRHGSKAYNNRPSIDIVPGTLPSVADRSSIQHPLDADHLGQAPLMDGYLPNSSRKMSGLLHGQSL